MAFLKISTGGVWSSAGSVWKIPVPPERGKIEDKNGRVLATNAQIYKAYLDLSFLRRYYDRTDFGSRKEIEAALNLLGLPEEILDSDKRFILLGTSRKREDLLSEIPPSILPFVNVSMEMKRIGVKDSSIPTIIGKVIDGKGIGGVEQYMDEVLRGKRWGDIKLRYTGFINLQPEVLGFNPPIDGSDVKLSLDLDLQRFIYSEILRAVRESSAVSGGAIMMEVKTGKILAMVTTRDWNDNVLGYIEPGSTIKPVIYSIALQSGAIDTSFHHTCKGWIKPVENLNIRIGDIKAHGDVDLEKALVESCNTASVKIAKRIVEKIGKRGFYEWLKRFGFGEKTGIEIAGEVAGALRKPEEWSAIDFAEFAIGQGIGVTPIQLIAALNTVVNGGVYVKPSILLDSSVVKRRVIDKRVANLIKSFMVEVVEKGTGVKAKVANLKIAGKTGTAQKAEGGKYVKKYRSLFVGAFPADDPEYILLVQIDEPKGKYLGGDVAAPLFARIVEGMRQMKREKPLRVYPGVLPDLKGLSLKDVLSVAKILNLNPIVHGSGIVVRQSPSAGTLNPDHLEVWLEMF